jgi:hypothetical protein
MSRYAARIGAPLVLVSLVAAGCGPILLTPVPQPIPCHCPGTTTVFRGELQRTAHGTSVTRNLDLAVERSREKLRVSLFDGATERALCSVTTDPQGAWQNGPACPDPLDPAGTNSMTLVRGSLSVRENTAELVFDAVLQVSGTPEPVTGHFIGKLVTASIPSG